MKEISQKVFDVLKEQNKTQSELASILGIKQSAIASWKIDNTNPKAEYLPKIANFLNVSVDYLVGIDKGVKMTIYERIDILRSNENISINELEKRCGLTRQTIEKWKTRCNPSADSIEKLAKYFDVSTDYLLGVNEQKKPTGEPISFERFSKVLYEKGLSDKDVENLSDERLAAIAEIIKNFKQ